jgi:hypothetical protein
MNTLEERIRTAVTQTAEEITPGSIPPLALHVRVRSGRRTRADRTIGAGRRGSRWPRVLIPVAAAASVMAVVAASLVLPTLAHRPAHPARHLPKGTVPLGAAPAYDGGTVPPYYVALEPGPLSGAATRAVVRATATGAEIAVVTPPRPYHVFMTVSAAADDRTFVIAAQHGNPEYGPPSDKAGLQKFFLLRLDPADHTARLTALPIPGEPGSNVITEALTPNGDKLAILLAIGAQEQEIQVISLRTGSVRTWRGTRSSLGNIGEVVGGADMLSWTADGRTLAFEVITGPTSAEHEIRLLDTTAPGSSLSSSRVAMRLAADAADAIITPDGSKIAVPIVTQTTREFAEYSVATGKLVAVLGIRHYRHASYGGWPLLFWANPTGSTLIVDDDKPNGPQLTKTGEPDAGVLAVVTGSRFTPLPGSDEIGTW